MLLRGQGFLSSEFFRAVGIKIRGFGGLSDEAMPKRAPPGLLSYQGTRFLSLPKERNGVHSLPLAPAMHKTIST